MHIPDGFINGTTAGVTALISAAALGYSAYKVKKQMGDKYIPLLGVIAAFIFAAQMLNFPVAAGTSGHFVGGVLAAALLGPEAGLLVMASVIVVQAFIFQDGGLTALGANILNMGFVGTFLGYYFYVFLKKVINQKAALFISAWTMTVAASAFCAVELAVSGVVPLKFALPAMAGVHALIGLGEAVITVAAFAFVKRLRPDLIR